ncbi:MAG: hypothetical protein FWH48_00485 [Oscillospiraceae bacterium]|nr:hypothetical protein [Oscillospiraceae bacterium]
MFKKCLAILSIALFLALMFQQVALAAVLEIDTGSDMFKSDTWQSVDDSTPDQYGPIAKALSKTPTAGVDAEEISRFSACLLPGENGRVNSVVTGEQSIENGARVSNAYFPFVETVKIDSISWKQNNAVRVYFFNFYTSMDGVNWVPVAIEEGAVKVTTDNSWDEYEELDGPPIECYAAGPYGEADDGDINPVTFKTAQTSEAKYLKVALYGNDGGNGDNAIANMWFSFNSFEVTGEVVVAEVAVEDVAEVVEVDVGAADADIAPPPPAAPASDAGAVKTGNDGMIALFATLAIAAMGMAIFKKKFVK